jgi:AraC-like DNA-binding protein
MDAAQKARLLALLDEYSSADGLGDTPIPFLHCYRATVPTAPKRVTRTVYQPSLCFVVQGRKQAMLEGEVYRYAAGQYLVVSVDLPLIGQVIEASPKKPYCCLQVDLDPQVLSETVAKIGTRGTAEDTPSRGLFVGDADAGLTDAMLRLIELLNVPQDAGFLSSLIVREIYYRLLTGPYGRAVAQVALKGSTMQRIAAVIQRLRTDFAKPLRVETLAELAHMSPSSFHQHFKAATAMSPLQYQKRIRLVEARRLMLSDSVNAAQAAYRVGYESISQFSREYARLFGAPPRLDVERMRGD